MLGSMYSRRFWMLLSGGILLLSCLIAGAVQMVRLERAELEHESPWAQLTALKDQPTATRISARITEVELKAGEQSIFELCTQDAFLNTRWKDAFDVVIWEPSLQRVELRIPLDDAHLAQVKRSERRSCLTLGGGRIERTGTYAMDVVWAEKPTPSADLSAVPLKARVLAKTPLSIREGLMVFGAALGALLIVLSGFAQGGTSEPRRTRTVPWALAGTLLALALAAGILHIPVPGAIGGLVRGLTLSLVQIGIAVSIAFMLYQTPRFGLGLMSPAKGASAWLLIAVLVAFVLRPVALFALSVIPQTGEAPIEAFISFPSGALSFALLGMVLPLAEELFFRGFVYGSLAPLGRTYAFSLTTLLFASVHAQQTWGNWGALLAVTLTGAALTLLRALSGSTLVSGVAHLLYNLSLWTDAFRS